MTQPAMPAPLSADAIELLKLRTILDAGYSGPVAVDLARRLKGRTESEIRADLPALVEFVSALRPPADPAVDPSQGYGIPDSSEPEFYSRAEEIEYRLTEPGSGFVADNRMRFDPYA